MKIIKVLGGIFFALGFSFVLGASGGLEQNLCSYTEFWQIAGCGILMVLVGGLCLGGEE